VPGIQVLRLDQPLLEIVWPDNNELTLLMLIKAHDAGRALVHTWDVGVQFFGRCPVLWQMEPAELLRYLGHKNDRFHHVIGSKSAIRAAAVCLGRKFMQGIAAADRLFPQRI
jgi:hypothetical protein